MIDEVKIMQYVDGTLSPEEKELVKKEIDANPKYQELVKLYQETGDILFNLGNEIQSKPLPNYLKEKIKKFNQSKQETNLFSFNFLKVFKIQYSAIAAMFCLFFVGGFYTNQYVRNNDGIPTFQTVDDKVSIQLRGANSSKSVINFYQNFNENVFYEELKNNFDKMKINQSYLSTLKDQDGKSIEFIYAKNISGKCKKFKFKEKVQLTMEDKGKDIFLDVCKTEAGFKIVNINIL